MLDWDRREFDELRNEASAKKTLGARFSLLKSLLSESLGNKFAFSKKEKNPNLAITKEDKKWIKECLLDHITKFVDRAKTQAGEDYQVPFDVLSLHVFKDSEGHFRFNTAGDSLGIHYTDAEKRTFMQKLKKLAEDLKNSLMERENVLLESLKLQFGDVNASLIEAALRKIRGTDEYKNKLLKEKKDRNLYYEL